MHLFDVREKLKHRVNPLGGIKKTFNLHQHQLLQLVLNQARWVLRKVSIFCSTVWPFQ